MSEKLVQDKVIIVTGAGGGKSVRLRFFFELFGHGGKIAAAKIYRV